MAWKALRMAATQIAARTTAINTAVITMRAPTKRMVPITAVRTKATLSARPGPVTDRPLSIEGNGMPAPLGPILPFGAITSAARPWSVVALGH